MVCLHLNSWMLVPHIQHEISGSTINSNTDDLDSFFEYVDEILFNNADQTPDNEENDGQTLDEVTRQDYCHRYHINVSNQFKLASNSQLYKQYLTIVYKERISLDIIAPPPDFV